MTGIWIAGVLGLAALMFVGIVLSRQSSRQKKKAIASLEAERATIATPTILDLVDEEVADLGLRELPGADGVPPDALLRAWRDAPEAVRAQDRTRLAFTVRPDADRAQLTAGDVELVKADGEPPVSSPADEPDDASDGDG